MPVLLLLASFLPFVVSQIPLLALTDTTACTDPFNITSTPTTGTDVASSFRTNAGPPISLSLVYIKSKLNSNVPSTSFSVNISSDDGAVPSRPLAVLTSATSVTLLNSTSEVDSLVATLSSPILLNENTRYWVVVSTFPNLPQNCSLCGAPIPPPANSAKASYDTARYIYRTSGGSAWSDSIETTPLLVPFSLFSLDVTSSSSSLSPTTSPTATPSSSSSPSPTPSPTPSLTPSSTETPSNSVTTGLTPSQSPTGTSSMTPSMTPSLTVNFTFSNSPSASHSPGASHTGPEGGCPEGEKIEEGRCLPIPRPPTVSASAASLDAGAVIAIILTLLIVGGIVACCVSPSFLAHFARFFLGCRRCLCNSESSAYPPEPANNFNVKNPLGAKV